jgi:hypothetical protein
VSKLYHGIWEKNQTSSAYLIENKLFDKTSPNILGRGAVLET